MSDDDFEVVRGSGNIYRDFSHPDADTLQMKAHLAAEIIGILNRRKLSTRAAGKLVGEDYSDISKIRNANLGRFTLDRLIRIANKLGRHVELRVSKIKDMPVHMDAHA